MRGLFKIFVEDKLAYYKRLFALRILIDDDVIAQTKEGAGIGDTIQNYLESDIFTRFETVYPNGTDSSEIIEAFIHLKDIFTSGSSIVC